MKSAKLGVILGSGLFFVFALGRLVWNLTANKVEGLTCRDPVCNFGQLQIGKSIEHTFVLTNHGSQPRTVLKVKPSCSCAVVDLAEGRETVVGPGASLALKARFSAEGRVGRQRSTVLVHSDDTKRPYLTLAFEGTATSQFMVSPPAVSFGSIHRDSDATQTVDVASEGDLSFAIRAAGSTVPGVAVGREVVEQARRFRIRLSIKDSAPTGVFRGFVNVLTEQTAQKIIQIPVSGCVEGQVVASPDEVVVASTADGRLRQRIKLRSRESRPFEVLSVEPPLSSILARATPTPQGGFVVELSNVIASDTLQGKSLRIVTDLEEIVVPFRVAVDETGRN
jgi:hypothetical protein